MNYCSEKLPTATGMYTVYVRGVYEHFWTTATWDGGCWQPTPGQVLAWSADPLIQAAFAEDY